MMGPQECHTASWGSQSIGNGTNPGTNEQSVVEVPTSWQARREANHSTRRHVGEVSVGENRVGEVGATEIGAE
jgi:hypothetical protein